MWPRGPRKQREVVVQGEKSIDPSDKNIHWQWRRGMHRGLQGHTSLRGGGGCTAAPPPPPQTSVFPDNFGVRG